MVQIMWAEGVIDGVTRFRNAWVISADAEKTAEGSVKSEK